MVQSRSLWWSIPCFVAFAALALFGLSVREAWSLWIGCAGAAVSGFFAWYTVSSPVYLGFLVLGTSRTSFLWRRSVWQRLAPFVDQALTVTKKPASIVWFPDRKNTSKEEKWSDDSSASWTFSGDGAVAGYDLAEFYESYIWAPARRQLVSQSRGLPHVYIKVANHRLNIPDSRSRCTQYFVLFIRKSEFRKHHAIFLRLLREVAATVESSIVGQVQIRMGDLNDFESGELTPYYLGEHTDELPQLSKMLLPWREVHLADTQTADSRGAV